VVRQKSVSFPKMNGWSIRNNECLLSSGNAYARKCGLGMMVLKLLL
jgi:hypothetical protein